MKKEQQTNLDEIKREFERWQDTTLKKSLESQPESKKTFTNLSGRPIDRLYTPLDTQHIPVDSEIGLPGEFPYTRGIHPTGYRGKMWTMRQFSGFSSANVHNVPQSWAGRKPIERNHSIVPL
jgi:methylmalonyl-CoA mutase N-terminal domain/subunit